MKRNILNIRDLQRLLLLVPGSTGVKIHQESHSSLYASVNEKLKIVPTEHKQTAEQLLDEIEWTRLKHDIFWEEPVTSYVEYRKLVGSYVNNETLYLVFSDEKI